MTQMFMPTRVDAVFARTLTPVIGPQRAFDFLPWFDGTRDHNGQTANLATAIMDEPFAEHQAWLEEGVHVHWAMPDGLTRGGTRRTPVRSVAVDDMWFAPLPNRWLVLRQPEGGTPDRAWRIESDFVHPEGFRPPGPHTVYHRHRPGARMRPWLRLGRQLELNPKTYRPKSGDQAKTGNTSASNPAITAATSLSAHGPALTAVAHGDPYFTAHYPSCRGVFGLHDNAPLAAGLAEYHVYGWYSDPDLDPLGRLVDDLLRRPGDALRLINQSTHRKGKARDAKDLLEMGRDDWGLPYNEAMKTHFGRAVFYGGGIPMPRSIICHGRARIDTALATDVTDPTQAAPVSVGSSASEAMAALLLAGAETSSDREDALVHGLAQTDLTAHALDFGAKLREARHTEQFKACKGHQIWAIRPREHDRAHGHQPALSLGDALAHELAILNAQQEHYDDLHDQISNLRQSLFADWSHYMRAAYPEGDQDPFDIDPGSIAGQIERSRLAPLETLLDAAGTLFTAEMPQGDQHVTDDIFFGAGGPAPYGDFIGSPQGDLETSVPHNGGLTGIRIDHGEIIDGVSLIGEGGVVDGIGGQANVALLNLHPDEHITALIGYHGIWRAHFRINRLGVETSFGRRLAPLGSDLADQTSFRLDAPAGTAITGLLGTSDTYMSSLRIMVSPLMGMMGRAVPPQGTAAAAVIAQHRIVAQMLRDQGSGDLALALTPGPRFWRPNDPVIALADPHARDTGRYPAKRQTGTPKGNETFYAVNIPEWEAAKATAAGFTALLAEHTISGVASAFASTATGENWHPLHLEWQVELEPLAEGGNGDPEQYDPDFITRQHSLAETAADLAPVGTPALRPTYEYISGRSSLNQTIGALMMERFGTLPDTLRAGITAPRTAPAILPLGGFHDKLLMRTHADPLPVEDPIGTPAQRRLAGRVAAALGRYHPSAPLPQARFHPIRSGELLFQRLRLIDIFGRTKDWRPAKILKTARMVPPGGDADRARLPVRLSSAARLDFRWLSGAHATDLQSNSHPATSPVCGWILPNELNREIDLFDRHGRLLGSVNAQAQWTPAPGDAAAPRSARDIANPTLRRVLDWMLGGGDALPEQFIDLLDAAMAAIDPADAARHQARAMFIGRPLAIVRARLGLSLKEGTAHAQSTAALRARIDGTDPGTSHGAEEVEIPLRLGEHRHLNDGLCGYWIEGPGGFVDRAFNTLHGLAPQTPHSAIRSLADDPLTDYPLRLSVAGGPVTVTMLMDPRGAVHATTGVLPVKSIAIPPDQYHDQIAALRAVFPTGPVLMHPGSVALPLPKEPGYGWSWITREGAAWTETPHHPTLTQNQLTEAFGLKGEALWDRLVSLGRIHPQDSPGTGLLWPAQAAAAPDRFDDLGLTPQAVETALHRLAHAIEPVPLSPRFRNEQDPPFSARSLAHSGWLQLRPLPQVKAPKHGEPR